MKIMYYNLNYLWDDDTIPWQLQLNDINEWINNYDKLSPIVVRFVISSVAILLAMLYQTDKIVPIKRL